MGQRRHDVNTIRNDDDICLEVEKDESRIQWDSVE
jgi:hypothetical protein